MKVYFRQHTLKGKKKLGIFNVELFEREDHTDAILDVKEALVASGEGYEEPVLAVIDGGQV